MTVTLRGAGLSESQVVDVARHGEKVALAAAARTRMERSRTRVERAATSREPVYGVSTGFGALAGVRPFVAEALIAMLNADITPVVPRYGSVGCSGDLAPLAHIGLALVGEGEVTDAQGSRAPAAQALKAAKLKPLKLETKEGLALINGTDGMLGMLALACADAELCFKVADI